MFYFTRLSILQGLSGDVCLFTCFVAWEISHVISPQSLLLTTTELTHLKMDEAERRHIATER